MERGYSRDETTFQRLDRNFAEVLQELRVAQTGAQLLLALQLTLAFTPRFAILTDFQRGVYVAALILGSAATALLIAPAPFHRVVFRCGLKYQLVRASSLFALFGTGLLMLSMMLILDVVLGTQPAVWITTGMMLWFCLFWYALPFWHRSR